MNFEPTALEKKFFGIPVGDRVLSAEARRRLPREAFAIPDTRSYPIHDLSHARNALARVVQFGTREIIAKVRRAVYKRWPQLNPENKED